MARGGSWSRPGLPGAPRERPGPGIEGPRDLNADLDVRNIVSKEHDVVALLGCTTTSKEPVDLVEEAAPQPGELVPGRCLGDDCCRALRCRPDADLVIQRDSSRHSADGGWERFSLQS